MKLCFRFPLPLQLTLLYLLHPCVSFQFLQQERQLEPAFVQQSLKKVHLDYIVALLLSTYPFVILERFGKFEFDLQLIQLASHLRI